jgi:RNA polymerase sigma factor (TIGR02999 family)
MVRDDKSPQHPIGPVPDSSDRPAMGDATRILSRIESGDAAAANELLPLVYQELRQLAAAKMAQENPGQTLQATALVHEAYIRLVDVEKVQHWDSRGHFFAAAAEAMRRILVESARHKKSLHAGGGHRRRSLDQVELATEVSSDELLELNEAVERLLDEDPQAAAVAKLRLFAGFTLDDVATSLGQPRTTVFRQWTYARAFLQMHLGTDASPPR